MLLYDTKKLKKAGKRFSNDNTRSSREPETYSSPSRIEKKKKKKMYLSLGTPTTGSFGAAVDPPPRGPCILVHFGLNSCFLPENTRPREGTVPTKWIFFLFPLTLFFSSFWKILIFLLNTPQMIQKLAPDI